MTYVLLQLITASEWVVQGGVGLDHRSFGKHIELSESSSKFLLLRLVKCYMHARMKSIWSLATEAEPEVLVAIS